MCFKTGVRMLFVVMFGVLFPGPCVGAGEVPALGGRDSPRLVLRPESGGHLLRYPAPLNHSVLYHRDGADELYLGGSGVVLKVDVDGAGIVETLPLKTSVGDQCSQAPCDNVITLIQEFQDALLVCGTNGLQPRCWNLVNNLSSEAVESYEGGLGISPYVYTQNSLSLSVEGELYTVAPLDVAGTSPQFRRMAGSRAQLWMFGDWVSEPTFISASWVQQPEDPNNEKIYFFFRERNSDRSPEAQPWISRVARVCKVDEGGSKSFFQRMWTSFLKARLACGFQTDLLYFNRLLDLHVLRADDWRHTRVYALFKSSWNSTAVCIYSVRDIEHVFETSTFKGYQQQTPDPRPGACNTDSHRLPFETLNVVRSHPEMSDWVHPVNPVTPLYVTGKNYTRIAADHVQAADQRTHQVLLLGTDSGKIYKVLISGSELFIISETQFPNRSALHSMTLDSKKRRLLLGFAEGLSSLDLQSCGSYNASCEECVLARDPYCAWSHVHGCTPTAPGGIQNVVDGQTNVCSKAAEDADKVNPSRTDGVSSAAHSVPLGLPFYLSCPIGSFHAAYTWEHAGRISPCLQVQSSCLHLVPAADNRSYGNYRCISRERDFTKVMMEYQVSGQRLLVTRRDDNQKCNVGRGSHNSAAAVRRGRAFVALAALVTAAML